MDIQMYHEGSRELQDRFGSRQLADRLVEVLARTAFTEDDRKFIESRPLFFLATADAAGQRILLDWLLGQHRHRINDLLARSAVDAARRHWNLVRELPTWASQVEETLGRELAERIERFHDEVEPGDTGNSPDWAERHQ